MLAPVGYCAAIIPASLFWQGYFINETPDIVQDAERLIEVARSSCTNDHEVFGCLQAVFIDCARANMMSGVAAAAWAMRPQAGDFFFVRGEELPHGIVTRLTPLKSRSINEARRATERLEDVMAIKARVRDRMALRATG